jgi:hypothetical protein
MQLVSYKSHNRREPHFRLREPHAPGCPLVGERGVGDPPEPGPEPVRRRVIFDELVLDDGEEEFDSPDPDGPSGPSRPGGPEGPGGPVRPWVRRKARSVCAIVQLYHEMPELRDEPLRVPGCRGQTYGYVFRPLSWNRKDSLNDRRIYYGSLHFGVGLVERPNGYEVTFIQGAEKDLTRKFRLLVSTAGWTLAEAQAVRRKLDQAIEKTRKAHGQDRPHGTPVIKPWIFFLGEPVIGEPMLFVVDHPQAICSFEFAGPRLGGA